MRASPKLRYSVTGLALVSFLACGSNNVRSGEDPIVAIETPTPGSPTPVPAGPTILAIAPVDYTHLTVTFSEPVEPTSAENPSNYVISPGRPLGISISQATRDSSEPAVVRLTVTRSLLPLVYTVVINNVRNLSGGTILAGSNTSVTGNGKVVFVTQASGTGNLSTWPEANGVGGIYAAATICATEAAAAGFVGSFAAWLSIPGYGGPPPPPPWTFHAIQRIGADSGGWVRTDGFPFAMNMTGLTAGDQLAFVPVLFDADENPLPADATVWTATDPTGLIASTGGGCLDWNGTTGTALYGSPQAARHEWTRLATGDCGASRHLYCFQTGSGAPAVPAESSAGKIAFLTSGAWTGDFGGLAGADAKCRNEAEKAELPGSFVAWLSDGTHDAIDRVTGTGPWHLINGVRVAESQSDLSDGRIFTTINQDAKGRYYDLALVWTGTLSDGTKAGDNCDDWGITLGLGRPGASSATVGGGWTDIGASQACNSLGRLYCLEN